jgi:DNA-binding transcriptional LysR family regulator
MELRHLRYFIAVAEELHFGHAAKRIGIAQPALSKQIRNLEVALKAKLLERTTQRVQLTPAGEALLVYARKLVAEADEAQRVAFRAARGEIGRVSIGLAPAMVYTPLPEAVASFARRHPNVEVHLAMLSNDELSNALRGSRVDVAFMRAPLHGRDFVVVDQLLDELYVALPATHPLTRQGEIDLRALRDEQFVLMVHPYVRAACEAAGFTPRMTPNLTATGRDLHLVGSLIAAGMGISLCSRSTAECMVRKGVVVRPLRGAPASVECLVVRRDYPPSPLLAAFLEEVCARFEALREERAQTPASAA